jgi:hypothetical protein
MGVPVRTSRPKRPASRRRATAPYTLTPAVSGLEARNPMTPPAWRIPSAPICGVGMPCAMCTRPVLASVRKLSPTARRVLAASDAVARIRRTPRPRRTSGNA